jgi:hypothetical protein
MPKQDKVFNITGVFEISVSITAFNEREAKQFAQEYFPQLVQVDVNELNDVMINSITPIKRFKVVEITEEVEQPQGEQNNGTN